MTYILPYPVSANRYWRTFRNHHVRSEEADIYIATVKWLLREHGVQDVQHPAPQKVALYLDFYRPQKSGDLDNLLKVPLDAFQGLLYDDDKQIVEIHAARYDDKSKPRIELRVEGR